MRITKKRAGTVFGIAATGMLVGAGLAFAATQPPEWDRVWACVHEDGRLAYFQFRDDADPNCGDGAGGLQRWSWTVNGPDVTPEQEIYAVNADPVDAVNIGGPINQNQTPTTATLDLPAGTYKITVDGAFSSTEDAAADAPVVRPQLTLYYDKDGDSRLDFSTDQAVNEGNISPNAVMPPVANRHVTVSGTTVLNVDGETPVGLVAFGYADDQSSARSGEIQLQYATLTATPVK